MDHAINSLMPFYEITLEQFIEEHKTGDYKKLSDNPYYDEIKALIDALNCLRRYLGWSSIKLSEEIELHNAGY